MREAHAAHGGATITTHSQSLGRRASTHNRSRLSPACYVQSCCLSIPEAAGL